MSGLMDKVKGAVGKGGESGGGESGAGGLADKAQSAGMEQKVDDYANKGIDQATDKAGMGDKYDKKIDGVADKQINKQL